MLEHEITYEDFNGNTVTETLYFNLTKTELIKIQTSTPGGMQGVLEEMVKSQDIGALLNEFDKIIIAAYGVRSEDGRKFIKNQEMRDEFVSSLAYDAIFQKVATDEKFTAEFILAVFPKDMGLEEAIKEAQTQTQTTAIMPPPTIENLPNL